MAGHSARHDPRLLCLDAERSQAAQLAAVIDATLRHTFVRASHRRAVTMKAARREYMQDLIHI
eukprot:scaffold742_cov395-Prasinococcus_capsulatus_cf.AAC.12